MSQNPTTTASLAGMSASNGDSVGQNKVSAGGDAAGEKLFKAGGDMENVGNTKIVQGDEINAQNSQGYVNRAENVFQLFVSSGSADPTLAAQLRAAMDRISDQQRLRFRDDTWAKQIVQIYEHPINVSPGKLQRAYLTVKKPRWTLPQEDDAIALFKRLVDELGRRQLIDGAFPPLLAFVEALIDILPVETSDRARLEKWLLASCTLWGIEPDMLATVRNQQNDVGGSDLLIAISGTTTAYMLQAWLWRSDGSLLNIWDQGGYHADELQQQIGQIYNTALDKVLTGDLTRIEFFLPDWLFAKPMHTWKAQRAFGKNQDGSPRLRDVEFYRRHLVVARSWDRNLSPETSYEFEEARRLWGEKWQRLEDAPGVFTSGMLEDAIASLYDYLIDDSIVCYAETYRANDESPFWSLVFAGLPLGVWNASDAELNTAVCHVIEALVAADKLMELPEQIKKRRRVAPQAPHEPPLPQLVLFWDDPNRRPSELQDYQLGTAR